MHLFPKRINLVSHGPSGTVCGWGANDDKTYTLETVKYFDNLNCIHLRLYGGRRCNKMISHGDYQGKLICGQADKTGEVTTLVSTF